MCMHTLNYLVAWAQWAHSTECNACARVVNDSDQDGRGELRACDL